MMTQSNSSKYLREHGRIRRRFGALAELASCAEFDKRIHTECLGYILVEALESLADLRYIYEMEWSENEKKQNEKS